MSNTPSECNSNSHSNLIEMQHVGVTAKLQSPLIDLQSSSSSAEETCAKNVKTKYNKLNNDTQMEDSEDVNATSETTNASKILYEMRSINPSQTNNRGRGGGTPSKIEFQLYHRPGAKRLRRKRNNLPDASKYKRKTSKRKLFNFDTMAGVAASKDYDTSLNDHTFCQRLRQSLDGMRYTKASRVHLFNEHLSKSSAMPNCDTTTTTRTPPLVQTQSNAQDTRIGIYPFEHGCADYLRTTDCHPQLVSVVLAERATQYATRFWAEFFGSLHIGVAFVVTFLLQCYRFILYSVINTLLVGFLHMTSDYLIKPILTVLFNGFLQPPLIFVYNILSSLRDILEPVADAINNFAKPIATVGRSIRLVHATYNSRKKFAKDV